jgi:hypothetical protein
MKYLVLIYQDPELFAALPTQEFNSTMRGCLAKADAMRETGHLFDSQMLEDPATARSFRVRNGRQTVLDGPFAETKEVLAGFNLIEADNMDDAVRLAMEFPWASTGCIEVRPVRDMNAVRQRVAVPS